MPVHVIHLDSLHTAHLDLFTGDGLLVLPNPDGDVWLGGSLHEAAWAHALRQLGEMGWVLSTDESDLPIEEGMTADGRPVLGLYCEAPIRSNVEPDELAQSNAQLRRVAGLM